MEEVGAVAMEAWTEVRVTEVEVGATEGILVGEVVAVGVGVCTTTSGQVKRSTNQTHCFLDLVRTRRSSKPTYESIICRSSNSSNNNNNNSNSPNSAVGTEFVRLFEKGITIRCIGRAVWVAVALTAATVVVEVATIYHKNNHSLLLLPKTIIVPSVTITRVEGGINGVPSTVVAEGGAVVVAAADKGEIVVVATEISGRMPNHPNKWEGYPIYFK